MDSRGRAKKIWMDRVKDDMGIKGLSGNEKALSLGMSDRREWKKKICCADPT
jgi:hypothetical protein